MAGKHIFYIASPERAVADEWISTLQTTLAILYQKSPIFSQVGERERERARGVTDRRDDTVRSTLTRRLRPLSLPGVPARLADGRHVHHDADDRGDAHAPRHQVHVREARAEQGPFLTSTLPSPR